MSKNTAAMAEAYYTAIAEKNVADLGKYLHPDVQFMAPLAQMRGKEAVSENVKKFAAFIKALTVRTTFGSGDQAMVAYDVEFPTPIGTIHSAALLAFQEGLIIRIELFYDARPFEKKA